MTALEVLGALASVATAIGVGIAASQLFATRRQAVAAFEDSLASQYRSIIERLPIEALLGERIDCTLRADTLAHFYQYFDLCNEQAFLHKIGRISEQTWKTWKEGILSNLRRPAFEDAWAEVAARTLSDFEHLRAICPPKVAQLEGACVDTSLKREAVKHSASALIPGLAIAVAAVNAGTSTAASAQDWFALHNQADLPFTLMVDRESVKRVPDQVREAVFEATWKEQRNGVADRTQTTGRIDCEQASVVVTRKQVYHSWFPNAAQRDVDYDYRASTRTDWRGVSSLSESERKAAERSHYPDSGSLNQMIRYVCQGADVFQERNERSGERIQRDAGCDSTASRESAMCSNEIDTRELLGRLVLRVTQVHRVCSISLATLYPLIESRYKAAATRCKDDARCFRADLGWMLSGFGRDLAAVTPDETDCRYTVEALNSFALETKREKSIERLNACAVDSIQTLDDRISPAESIARGVFGICRRELTDDLQRSAAFESKYITGLVGTVLQSRQQKASRSNAPKKVKSQKTTPA